jgi:hypothetical protein
VKDLLLGLDTELVVATKRGVLYPHVAKISQSRTVFDQPFDWHGDGYAWELCVAPSAEPEGIVANVAAGLIDLYRSWGIRSAVGPSMYMVQQRAIRTAPAEVRRLGCMPSFNMYATPGRPQGLPNSMRTTGCHIHVSSPEMDKENYARVVKWADLLVGAAWTYVSPEPAFDERMRRRYYGKAGEYRVRFYDEDETLFGVEYRSLPGNVLHHPKYLETMLVLMGEASKRAKEGEPDPVLTAWAVRVVNGANRDGLILEEVLEADMIEYLNSIRAIKARSVDIKAWVQCA